MIPVAESPRERALKLIQDAQAEGDAAKIDNVASTLLLGLARYEFGRDAGIAVVAELRAIARAEALHIGPKGKP